MCARATQHPRYGTGHRVSSPRIRQLWVPCQEFQATVIEEFSNGQSGRCYHLWRINRTRFQSTPFAPQALHTRTSSFSIFNLDADNLTKGLVKARASCVSCQTRFGKLEVKRELRSKGSIYGQLRVARFLMASKGGGSGG